MQDHLIIVPGVRYDENDTYGQETNPQRSVIYRFPTKTTLRASVGRSVVGCLELFF